MVAGITAPFSLSPFSFSLSMSSTTSSRHWRLCLSAYTSLQVALLQVLDDVVAAFGHHHGHLRMKGRDGEEEARTIRLSDVHINIPMEC